jgi:hypothetical protein
MNDSQGHFSNLKNIQEKGKIQLNPQISFADCEKGLLIRGAITNTTEFENNQLMVLTQQLKRLIRLETAGGTV